MITQKKLGKKIKDFRESFEMSQEDFAGKIGLSRVAVSQLESGNRGIDAIELAKISNVFGVSIDFILKQENPRNIGENNNIGNAREIKFNKEKLKNVVLYILEKCGGKPNLGETVLYKLLYFLDFNNYELRGESITGMSYVKLQFGPVPKSSEFTITIKEMIKNNQIKIIPQDYHGMTQKRYIALSDSDFSVFKSNLDELRVIDEVIFTLSGMNAVSIENYVHGDIPWRDSSINSTIEYDLVFNRTVPYAKRNYELNFLQAGADDVHKSLKPLTEDEYNYYKNL